MARLNFIFIFLLFSFSMALAHEDHSHHEPETVKEFSQLAHHEMEETGAHGGSFKSKALAGFRSLNPKRMFLRALSFYNKKSIDPKWGDHAKNLVLLLPISESLEIATGPYVTSILMNSDLPWYLDSVAGAIAWGISIPFVVEPYCAAMIGVYSITPPLQKALTKVRYGFTKAKDKVCQVTGLDVAYEAYFPQQNIFDEFLKKGWAISVPDSEDESIFVWKEDSERSLLFELRDSHGLYISSVEIEGYSKSEVKKELGFLTWSVRSRILQDYARNGLFKAYETRTLLMRPKRKLCEKLFKNS